MGGLGLRGSGGTVLAAVARGGLVWQSVRELVSSEAPGRACVAGKLASSESDVGPAERYQCVTTG